jgi:hypothetical protein
MFSTTAADSPAPQQEGADEGTDVAEAPAPTEAAETTEPAGEITNLADQAGAGEENEETVIEQRGKLFLFEDGENISKGLGQFKVKRAKEAEGGKRKRRLLMRVQGSGNVLLVRDIAIYGLEYDG